MADPMPVRMSVPLADCQECGGPLFRSAPPHSTWHHWRPAHRDHKPVPSTVEPAPEDMNDRVAFLTAEVTYWRQVAERHEAALRAAEEVARDGIATHEPPPEPPVGTEFHRDGMREWKRLVDGWHCPNPNCRNCPAHWQEVWDRSASGDRVTRKLPGVDHA